MQSTIRYKKRCVWCWKKLRGDQFRRVGIKRLEVCTACESKDPETAAKVTLTEAKRLKRILYSVAE